MHHVRRRARGLVPVSPFPDFIDRVYAKSCDVMAELPNESIDCVVTSPPYEKQRAYSPEASNHGNYAGTEFITRMRVAMLEVFRVLKNDGSGFINFHHSTLGGFASSTLHDFPEMLESVGLRIVQPLTWLKTNAQPIASEKMLKPAVEAIYHVAKSRDYYVDKNAIRTPSIWASRDNRPKKNNPLGAAPPDWLCPALDDLRQMSVQDVLTRLLDPEAAVLALRKTQDQSTVHSAKMPDALADWLIRYGCPREGTLLDPWAGSGTSLCRARALGRRFVGYELVPAFAQLCEERLAQVRFGEALEADKEESSRRPPMPSRPQSADNIASQPADRPCKHCGKPFTPSRAWSRFCTPAHRHAHNNARNAHGKEEFEDDTQADPTRSRTEAPTEPEDDLHLDK